MCDVGEQSNRKSEMSHKVVSLWSSTSYVRLVHSGAPTSVLLVAISSSSVVSLWRSPAFERLYAADPAPGEGEEEGGAALACSHRERVLKSS